jgi:molybdate transport system substrate-binding protein
MTSVLSRRSRLGPSGQRAVAFARLAWALVLAAIAARAFGAERVAVAAAANLVYVLEPLDAAFARADPGVTLAREIGASGTLVAQIVHGAPYDVFLSADLEFPQKLVAAGAADGPSLVTFAVGRLVLWTLRSDLALTSIEAAVRNPAVTRIAVANPRTAPYGRAAEEVLAQLGLTAMARTKLVYGENISQTAHYVASGNVDAGFVALSLVHSPQLKDRGRWLEIPSSLYTPLAQGAVLTRRGAANPAARRYLKFLQGPAARAILTHYGYALPPFMSP